MVMPGSLIEKLGLKENSKVLFYKAPKDVMYLFEKAGLEIKKSPAGQFDYIHYFVIHQSDMKEYFPKLKEHLKSGGSLWVSWPKAGKLNTDLTIKTVIKIGYDFGLVESKAIRIDDNWSALKFTFPKQGKIYNNSYGKLAT